MNANQPLGYLSSSSQYGQKNFTVSILFNLLFYVREIRKHDIFPTGAEANWMTVIGANVQRFEDLDAKNFRLKSRRSHSLTTIGFKPFTKRERAWLAWNFLGENAHKMDRSMVTQLAVIAQTALGWPTDHKQMHNLKVTPECNNSSCAIL